MIRHLGDGRLASTYGEFAGCPQQLRPRAPLLVDSLETFHLTAHPHLIMRHISHDEIVYHKGEGMQHEYGVHNCIE